MTENATFLKKKNAKGVIEVFKIKKKKDTTMRFGFDIIKKISGYS